MTIRGDQQVPGESFVATDLYAPILKAHESRLLLAIAAAEGCSVYKTNTTHAFLYGSMENDVIDMSSGLVAGAHTRRSLSAAAQEHL